MTLISVKFLVDWDKYNAGELAGFDEKTVADLENRGIAKRNAPAPASKETAGDGTSPAAGIGGEMPSPSKLKNMNKTDLAALAREPVPQAVLDAYGLKSLAFGREYILPKPFDPRLIERIPAAIVAGA